MKLPFFIVVIVMVIVIVFSAPAAHAVTLSISGSIPGVAANATDPGAWIQSFYALALTFGGVLAFGAVVYGGVLYAASAGNPSKQSEGKEWIWSALIGLMLLAGAWLVLYTISPGLTNVSFPTLSSLQATPSAANGNATGQSGSMIVCQGSTNGTCAISGQTCSCTAGNCSCQSPSSFTCSGSTLGTCSGNESCVRTDSGQAGTSPTYGCQ